MQDNNRKIRGVQYRVHNQSGKDNGIDIEIYDYIGEYLDWPSWEMKGVTYESFKAEFESALSQNNRVNIRINSYGGDVNAGIAIYNLIQRYHGKDIHVYIDAAAYSMGIVIAQAVNKPNRHCAKNATIMVHQASTFICGDYNAIRLRDEANIMDTFDSILATSMADTMGISVEDFKAQFFDGKDHFMTADEALEYGLVDDIYQPSTDNTSEPTDATVNNSFVKNLNKRFDKLEQSIRNFKNQFLTKNTPDMTLDGALNILNSGKLISNEERNELKEIISKFNTAKFTNEEVETKIAEATNPLEDKIASLEAEKTGLSNKLNETLLNKGGANPENAQDTPPVNGEEKGFKYRPINIR